MHPSLLEREESKRETHTQANNTREHTSDISSFILCFLLPRPLQAYSNRYRFSEGDPQATEINYLHKRKATPVPQREWHRDLGRSVTIPATLTSQEVSTAIKNTAQKTTSRSGYTTMWAYTHTPKHQTNVHIHIVCIYVSVFMHTRMEACAILQ